MKLDQLHKSAVYKNLAEELETLKKRILTLEEASY
jgi:hypothetical protein